MYSTYPSQILNEYPYSFDIKRHERPWTRWDCL